MDKNKFLEWLSKEKGFTIKSCRDVTSRLKRVENFIKFDTSKNESEALQALDNSKDFQQLSIYVMPQLRRAIRLFYEFKNSN